MCVPVENGDDDNGDDDDKDNVVVDDGDDNKDNKVVVVDDDYDDDVACVNRSIALYKAMSSLWNFFGRILSRKVRWGGQIECTT